MDINVLNNFELPKDQTGNFKAKCLHCASSISGSLKVTSNFITHMRRKHRDELSKAPEKSDSSIYQQTPITQYTGKSKYSSTDPRQIQITDALLGFIAGDLISLSVVESKHFKAMMEKANPKYQVPSRKHLSTKLIHEKSSALRIDLKHQLKLAQNVCLTLDLWSNRQMRGFLGITGHFIQNWCMKSVMIACSRFKGKHTAENIRQEYEETIACFEIADKVTNIVSDNAANMVKAFNFPIPGFEKDELNENEESQIINDLCEETCDSSEDNAYKSFECLPRRSSCYAHTLQLVVRDGLKDCGSHLKQVISKASNIVSFVRRSILASEILEDEKRLQASNSTRWNSQLYMLKFVLNVNESKLNSLDCSYKLSTYERKLLQELCTILEPFEKATLLVQKETNVSASLTVPVTLGLIHQMKKVSSKYNSKMVSTLQSSVQSRLGKYEQDESYIIAAILDPRFKLRWCPISAEAEDHIGLMRCKLEAIEIPSDQNLCSPPNKTQKDNSDDFFSFLPSSAKKRTRRVSGAVDELDIYLEEECLEMEKDPLKYWSENEEKLPSLAKLAQRYLSLPASSAPVERLFSIAGKIFRPERCSLSDTNFEALMMLKCNSVI